MVSDCWTGSLDPVHPVSRMWESKNKFPRISRGKFPRIFQAPTITINFIFPTHTHRKFYAIIILPSKFDNLVLASLIFMQTHRITKAHRLPSKTGRKHGACLPSLLTEYSWPQGRRNAGVASCPTREYPTA